MEIDISDAIKEVIENSLDAELSVYEYGEDYFLSISLTWNGVAFAGKDINIDNILNKEESE